MLTGAATIFVVRDIAASTAYYRDALGFTVEFLYGEPTFYACLCRDEVALHLISDQKTNRAAGNGAVAIFVKDVDALHAELARRDAIIEKPPQHYAYGMRDFNVADLDGNQMTFGMSTGVAT